MQPPKAIGPARPVHCSQNLLAALLLFTASAASLMPSVAGLGASNAKLQPNRQMLRATRLDFHKAREVITPQNPSYAAAIKAAEVARNAAASSHSILDDSNTMRLGWQKRVFQRPGLNENASTTTTIEMATGRMGTGSAVGSSAAVVKLSSQTSGHQTWQASNTTGPISCASQRDCTGERVCLNEECVCPVKGSTTCPSPVRLPGWCVAKLPSDILSGKRLQDLADWSRCAVVASGKPKRDYGKRINEYTAVIRMNNAPTKGYDKLVGRKTTLRMQNIERCGYAESEGELCIHYSRTGSSAGACNKDFRKSKCRPLKISKHTQTYVQKYWSKVKYGKGSASKLSAGFFAMAVALNICGEVHLFGFSEGADHYYPKKSQKNDFKKAHHNWSAEKACIKYLKRIKSDKVRVFE